MRKKYIYIITGIIIFFISSITIPKILIDDMKNLTDDEKECVNLERDLLLDNPIERLLIIETSIDKKDDDVFETSAYTIAGVKYAKVEVKCDEGSEVKWRLFDGK